MTSTSDDKITVPVLSSGISYPEWHEELKSAMGYKKVWGHCQRWEDDQEAKKPRPLQEEKESKADYRKRLEDWEQSAELALSIIRKALGDYEGSVQNIDNPLDAYERVKKLYSSETEYDIITLMTDFCELAPVGNAVPQYLASMVRIQNNLKALGIKYDDKQVIGTALTKLRKYPEHSAWHKLYNSLSFKFKDSPKQVDMLYFERFVHQTIRDIEFQEKNKDLEVKEEDSLNDDAVFAARALKAGYVKRPFTNHREPYCRFCKKSGHWYENCDNPEFDPSYASRSQSTPKYDGKRKGRDRDNRNGSNRANVVKSYDNDDMDAQCYIQSAVLVLLDHRNPSSKSEAYLDSGSSRHIICDTSLFEHAMNVTRQPSQVIVGNGERVTAEARGEVPVTVVTGDARFNIVIENCLPVPKICTNLVSVSQLTENGYDVRFAKSDATISRNGGAPLVMQKVDKIYPMRFTPVSQSDKVFVTSDELWHMRAYGGPDLEARLYPRP